MSSGPHRRYNALTNSWVLVSPHRTQRPWQGKLEKNAAGTGEPYDSTCYLCPGNDREGGHRNPDYDGVFVFDNDFPALLPDVEDSADTNYELLRAKPVAGRCRVICYSPRHNLGFGDLSTDQINRVIETWAAEYGALIDSHEWVQIFENRGETMGCSNPHPHGQIWAISDLPTEARRELDAQRNYHQTHGSNLLDDYRASEIERGERTLIENDHWLVVVPFWAAWPFETLVIAKDPVAHLGELRGNGRRALAKALKSLVAAYDRLFSVPFPYTFGWHNAPRGVSSNEWRLHAHFYPPLLRSAEIRKFMVGFEMLAEPQRDITPELACGRLREVLPES